MPRLPRKTKVHVAKCHACHAHARSSSSRRLCVLRLPHDSQRRPRAQQLRQEALCTAPPHASTLSLTCVMSWCESHVWCEMCVMSVVRAKCCVMSWCESHVWCEMCVMSVVRAKCCVMSWCESHVWCELVCELSAV